MSAEDRVWRVVLAARRIASTTDPLGREARARLPAASGLSPAGVELALTEHLETHPTRDDVAALTASAGSASRTWVVLASNVCTAALRALACALASAPEVYVKPSRRDPVVAELLVRALAQDHGLLGKATLVDAIDPEPGDEIHAYGSDDTLTAIMASLPKGAAVRRHGSGTGVAVVERDAQIAAAATDLAADLTAFDGAGCASPRLTLVAGAASDAERFAERLHDSLTLMGERVARGALDASEQSELARVRSVAHSVGTWHEGPHHGIAVDVAPEALLLAPPMRATWVAACTAPRLASLLGALAAHVTTVGYAGPRELTARVATLCPGARVTPLGRMQKPPLDGPIDRRPSVTGKA